METLLREHAFRYSPFRSFVTGELTPDQYALSGEFLILTFQCLKDCFLLAVGM